MQEPIKALIFDVDQTLLDTRDFIMHAFRHAFTMYGLPDEPEAYYPLMGKPLEEIYRIMAPESDTVRLCAAHTKFQVENLHLAKPFPEVQETLTQLRTQRIKMAVVSSRGGSTVSKTLELAGIATYFDVVIDGSSVTNLKPDPEGILKAIARLDAKAHETVMVGDTDIDVLAGQNALVRTVVVSYGARGEKVRGYNADFVIDHFSELAPIVLSTHAL